MCVSRFTSVCTMCVNTLINVLMYLTRCKNSKTLAQNTQNTMLLKIPGFRKVNITTITGKWRIPVKFNNLDKKVNILNYISMLFLNIFILTNFFNFVLPAPYQRPTGALPVPYRHTTGVLLASGFARST